MKPLGWLFWGSLLSPPREHKTGPASKPFRHGRVRYKINKPFFQQERPSVEAWALVKPALVEARPPGEEDEKPGPKSTPQKEAKLKGEAAKIGHLT